MARDEAPPWARGETYYNGETIDTTNIGGPNLEGKEFVFEPNSQDNFTGTYQNASTDTSGRPIRVKVVRNISAVNLLPARVARFSSASTASYEGSVDGYCTVLADKPAGVIDEMLPAAGVAPNDLFYLVISGPSQVTQGATTAATLVVGTRMVPAAYGATAGDPLGGRVAAQDITGATTALAQNIMHQIGYAASINSTAANAVNCVVHLLRW